LRSALSVNSLSALSFCAVMPPHWRLSRCHVRFGSKPEVITINFDIRFTPESGHSTELAALPLWAIPPLDSRLSMASRFGFVSPKYPRRLDLSRSRANVSSAYRISIITWMMPRFFLAARIKCRMKFSERTGCKFSGRSLQLCNCRQFLRVVYPIPKQLDRVAVMQQPPYAAGKEIYQVGYRNDKRAARIFRHWGKKC